MTAQIGVGGMEEVYRAIDTNLKRGVAIKVLPSLVAADADRLARFQREAEVLAALNHPHIAAIYSLERSGRTTFSWMPDNRHVVLSTSPGTTPQQLYMADTVSTAFTALSGGTTPQSLPAVSPDGKKLVFVEATTDYDIVSMSLANAVVAPLITTTRSENQRPYGSSRAAPSVNERAPGHRTGSGSSTSTNLRAGPR